MEWWEILVLLALLFFKNAVIFLIYQWKSYMASKQFPENISAVLSKEVREKYKEL